ncbi:MAG: hypothetical protein U0R26_12155 [Solirubrobacterales bacterium]
MPVRHRVTMTCKKCVTPRTEAPHVVARYERERAPERFQVDWERGTAEYVCRPCSSSEIGRANVRHLKANPKTGEDRTCPSCGSTVYVQAYEADDWRACSRWCLHWDRLQLKPRREIPLQGRIIERTRGDRLTFTAFARLVDVPRGTLQAWFKGK